ncbi:membrane protein [Knoellia sinensis KCTC 19936]|uniref:Probable membrane transporter protein n=1 Tax=Knoellia sinensis KCTC 19936 TaxID=1385520 RepID=A0A0A0J5K8_9MICO|nr:sulfite exporter TauE/SafE family protein [Knoellia sinensis]KGN32620.1 membrane protein [Knoellia sinensis KCTC 19936]
MGPAEAALIFAAGIAAGTINTVVGSGTLVTFPTLLFFGYAPVTANVSNSVGLVAGGLTGSWGYRHELRGAWHTLLRWMPMSLLGGVVGAVLLLVLDPSAFEAIVPVLIGLGVALVMVGPRLSAWTAAHRGGTAASGALGEHSPQRAAALLVGIFATAVYGGYFGAAQGVILMGVLTTLTSEGVQRLNGIKNVLSTIVNAVAALTFIIVAPEHVNWAVAGLIGAGALIGGVIGARVGRWLPPNVLRAVIVVIGVVAIVRMIWFS